MIAVVTGGCSGLGKVFTEELLKRGYKVYALYNSSINNAYELENTYENVWCTKCDITDESLVEKVFFNMDDVDLVINNAAISKDNNYQEKTKKEFLSVLETNVVGTFLVIKNVIDKLNKKGIIVNISSNNAINNYNPISIDYDVSKVGVNMLTKEFKIILDELNKSQKIISICPGWINTESVQNMYPEYLQEEMKKVNQSKLIEPNSLVNHILDNLDNYENGEIVEIKEL